MPGALLDLMQRGATYLAGKGIANARRESEWIFAGTLGLSRLDIYTRHDMPLDDAETARLRERIQRRGRREPLAYVLGTQPFCGLELAVGPGVLVPRPETEELAEQVLAVARARRPGRLLDVGTGSGALALCCAQELPGWTVEATDSSTEALAIAQGNAVRLELAVRFHQGHLASGLAGGWDLVVANLPYIAEAERGECDPELAYEPPQALYAADHGLALIRELIADAPRLLADDGELWLEHGWQQGAAIADHAATCGLEAEILPDGAGRDRHARIRRPAATPTTVPPT